MHVLVTGASGFVGRHLLPMLRRCPGCEVSALGAGRGGSTAVGGRGIRWVQGPRLDSDRGWARALADTDVVLHLAALAHERATSAPTAQSLREVNVHGAARVARWSAACGVRRLILLSSSGVHGDATPQGPITEQAPTQPQSEYACSKNEAEQQVAGILENADTDFTIIRAPLVYGPGAPGNLRRLLRVADTPIPLPFAGLQQPRSLIAVSNLAHVLCRVLDHPAASRETFLVSDDDDTSVAALLRLMRGVLGRRAGLLPVPVAMMRAGARLIGRQGDIDKLVCRHQLDVSKARTRLDWTPPLRLAEGVEQWLGQGARIGASPA